MTTENISLEIMTRSNVAALNRLFAPLKEAQARAQKTAKIMEVLNHSLAKTGGFKSNNFNVQMEAMSASAKRLAKDIVASQKRMQSEIAQTRRLLSSFTKESNFTANIQPQAGFGVMRHNIDSVITGVKKVRKEVNHFDGELLSIMFLGMAMQRAFGGFLGSAFQTFKKVNEGTDKASNSVTRLSAGWEFFKYSLIDAVMNSGVFKFLIESLIKVVDWLNKLPAPAKAFLGITIGILAAIGAIVAIWGIFGLGVNALITKLAMVKPLFVAMNAYLTGTLIPTFAKLWAAAGPLLIVAGIILAIAWIAFLIHRVGGVSEAFKALARGTIRVFAIMAQGMADAMGPVFDWMLDAVNKLIEKIRSLLSAVASANIIGVSSIAQKILDNFPTKEELDKATESLKFPDAIRFLAEDFIAQSEFLKQNKENTFKSFEDFLTGNPLVDIIQSAPKTQETSSQNVEIVQNNEFNFETMGSDVDSANKKLNDTLDRLGIGEYKIGV